MEDGGLPMIRSVGQRVPVQRELRECVTLRKARNVVKTAKKLTSHILVTCRVGRLKAGRSE